MTTENTVCSNCVKLASSFKIKNRIIVMLNCLLPFHLQNYIQLDLYFAGGLSAPINREILKITPSKGRLQGCKAAKAMKPRVCR